MTAGIHGKDKTPNENTEISERREIEIKTIYLNFIKKNCVLEGEPHLVEEMIQDMACELFEIFVYLTKK